MNDRPQPTESDAMPTDATTGLARRFATPLRWTLLVALVIAFGWAFQSNLLSLNASSNETETTQTVSAQSHLLAVTTLRVGQIQRPDLTRAHAGSLNARKESSLSFESAGRVVLLTKQEGQMVSAGERIAELDQENLDANADRIKSELAAAQAKLDELIAGTREETLEAARNRVAELESRVELAKVDADRQARLIGTNATSRAAFDEARINLQATERGLRAQRSVLAELAEGTRKEQIEAARAQRDSVAAMLREIDAQRRDAQIEAPFDGVIQSRMIDEGVVLQAATPVYHLISREIEGKFALAPEIVASLQIGQGVAVSYNDEKRPGLIDRIEPMIDPKTHTRQVYVRLSDEPPPSWVAGGIAYLHTPDVTDADGSDKFWMPRSALTRSTRGLWTVLVVPGEEQVAETQRRALELLMTDGEYALVQGMLTPGERVISDGLHRVTSGMQVRVLPETVSADTPETANAPFALPSLNDSTRKDDGSISLSGSPLP